MRTVFLCLALLGAVNTSHAQDQALYWKYKDYDGAISFTVPGWMADVGSLFVKEKEERRLIRKVNKVRVLVFEGQSPVTERDMQRFTRKASRRHLDDLIMVRDGKTHVHIMAKERRNKIRKVVVLVKSPEEFVFVSLRGKLRFDDINRLIEKYSKKAKKDEKPLLPPVIKVPVSRV